MSGKTQEVEVVESVKGTVGEAFNLSTEQVNKVIQGCKSSMDKYNNSEITNCQMVKDCIALFTDENEKLYASYISGIYYEHLQKSNPFAGLFGSN